MPHESVSDAVDVPHLPVRERTTVFVEPALANLDHDTSVRLATKGLGFDDRVDKAPLARPIRTHTVVSVNIPTLHAIGPLHVLVHQRKYHLDVPRVKRSVGPAEAFPNVGGRRLVVHVPPNLLVLVVWFVANSKVLHAKSEQHLERLSFLLFLVHPSVRNRYSPKFALSSVRWHHAHMTSAELTRAEVNGHCVAYRCAGDGPPLILLHGFLCDSRCWRPQLADLSDSFRVVAWDAPGAGSSSDPPDPFTITNWAQSLAQFLDVTSIERVQVLGLSWGGILAQEFYRLYPARVLALVLCDTYPGWKGSLPASVCKKRLERCFLESSLPPEDFVPRWVPEFFTEGASHDLKEEMSAVVSDFHPLGFCLMAKSLADTDTTDLLPSIEVPTLLLWGDDDRRSPMNIAEQLREAIPNAELAIIANAGHLSNMEQPEEFNAQVRRFCLSNLTT